MNDDLTTGTPKVSESIDILLEKLADVSKHVYFLKFQLESQASSPNDVDSVHDSVESHSSNHYDQKEEEEELHVLEEEAKKDTRNGRQYIRATQLNKDKCRATWMEQNEGSDSLLQLIETEDGFLQFRCALCENENWYKSPSSIKQHCKGVMHQRRFASSRKRPREDEIEPSVALMSTLQQEVRQQVVKDGGHAKLSKKFREKKKKSLNI